jgi:hypothetical protein
MRCRLPPRLSAERLHTAHVIPVGQVEASGQGEGEDRDTNKA